MPRTLHALLDRPLAQRTARLGGWAVIVPLLRIRARRRLRTLKQGAVTIVTVNWNSWKYLSVLLDVVHRRSPPGTAVLVVDNGSCDGSRARLRGRTDVACLSLPVNLGHDLALDLGVLSCRSEYVVTLDVDAFPLHDHWLDELRAPLHSGAEISGARLWRPFVHPCCLAMRTARFIERGHSFRARYVPRKDDREPSGDVGELMSRREAPRLHFFEITSQRGPSDVGTVFADLVYHNFYSTRFRATTSGVLDGEVTAQSSDAAWEEALDRYVTQG